MKKQNILEAAVKLIAANGLHATPMSAIAKAAGTGMGTIYNYFGTKEELINHVYVDIKQQHEALIRGLGNDKPVKERFEQYYQTTTAFYLEHPPYYWFMDQLQSSPIITPASRNSGEKAVEPVVELFKEGQKEGLIKNMNTEELLQFVGGTVLAYLGWRLSAERKNPAPLNNQLQLVWDAIKA